MKTEVTTSRRISDSIKGLRNILAKAKVTEAHPLVLKTPVKITQTLDGRGWLDWAYVSVKSLWHDRTTVVVKTTENETIRLIDCSLSTSNGYYEDTWWDICELVSTVRSLDLDLRQWFTKQGMNLSVAVSTMCLHPDFDLAVNDTVIFTEKSSAPKLPVGWESYYYAQYEEFPFNEDPNENIQPHECARWFTVRMNPQKAKGYGRILITDCQEDLSNKDFVVKFDWTPEFISDTIWKVVGNN